MDKLRLILVSGRSTGQGVGISAGKNGSEYQDATHVIELSASDMEKSGLEDGKPVTVASCHGTVDVRCRRSDLPEGMAFMAFGPACNRLVGEETYASGMPDSKHLEIEIEPLNVQRSTV